MTKGLSYTQILENRLSLQGLQINRLFEITQAINSNFPIESLFSLYKDTLTWNLQVDRFALYINKGNNEWECVSSEGFEPVILEQHSLETYFEQYTRPSRIYEPTHPILKDTPIVIPVFHKDYAIAYTFVGNDFLSDEYDNHYEPIQFISALTNVIAVAIENKRLFRQQLEQEGMKKELELAAQVQNMLIPTQLPDNNSFQFSGIYQPHKGVGGDYYDFFDLSDREVAFCIADISGKGIAAALLMSNFQASLQSLMHRKYLSVRKFITRLNASVLNATKGDRFITFFIARYNIRKRRIRYICAGHNPPFMYTNGKVQRLNKGCTLLGVFPNIPKIEFGEIYLDDDALFLLYTDGLTDMQNKSGDFFDDKKVEAFLLKNAHLNVADFNDELLKEVNIFGQGAAFPDDISFLTGRILVEKNKTTDETVVMSGGGEV